MATLESLRDQLADQPPTDGRTALGEVLPAPAAPLTGGGDLAGKVAYARLLAESGLLPAHYRRQPANLLWAVEYGQMLGLPPMAAIVGVHVIEGKPSASAALISALVRRAGHRLRVAGDDTHAVATIVRADDAGHEFRAEWDLDRAARAGLAGKGTWQKYPAAMLKARAITECARDACEEALSGVHYTPEELGAETGDDGAPLIVDALIVDEAPPPQQPAAAPASGADPDAPDQVPAAALAQRVADQAGDAHTTETVRALWQYANHRDLLVANVRIGDDSGPLGECLTRRAAVLSAAPSPAAQPEQEGEPSQPDSTWPGYRTPEQVAKAPRRNRSDVR